MRCAWLIGLLVCPGCDDGAASLGADAALDARAGSGTDAALDARADAGLPEVEVPDAAPDVGLDLGAMVVSDAAVAAPDATLPVAEPLELRALEAQVDGPHDRLAEGVLLDPGARLRWAVELPADLAALPALGAWLRAPLWRVEDGRLRVHWGGSVVEVDFEGDARAGWSVGRAPWGEEDDSAGWGVGTSRPARRLPAPAPAFVELEAVGGAVEIRALGLVDPRSEPPALERTDDEDGVVVEVSPCVEAGCDDAEALREALNAAPEAGRFTLRLAPGVFTLRSPLVVRRHEVSIVGAGPDTVLRWDPDVGGRLHALRFAGGGLGEAAPLVGPIASGDRRFAVDAPEGWAPDRVWIAADDFGDVPPACAEGRDIERFDRHLGQLARVLSLEPTEAGLRVTVDRPLHRDVPVAAAPRLVEVELLTGARVADLHLLGACPEALDNEAFGQVSCANAEVVDDNGLVFDWTEGARAERVSAQAIGKFSILVQQALDTRVLSCSMDHPAAYGAGGQGYGVHLIRASRSVVEAERVHTARHGVVVDFGSSDSQVLDGAFEHMNQVLIDVHGEASRDTLIRGNALRGSTRGVIVGGGGRETHCNDGPRHHVERNRLIDCTVAAFSVSDHTRGVWFRANTIEACPVTLIAAFGAGDLLLERNHVHDGGGRPLLLTGEGTGEVRVRANRFDGVCAPEQAALVVPPAERPTFEANAWCPD